MRRLLYISSLVVAACFITAPAAKAQFAATGTTTLSLTIGPEASIRVDTTTTSLTSPGIFSNFSGTTSFTYKIRTTTAGGTGAITSQVTSDFTGSGPSVASSHLTYTCTVASPGTACSGTQTASTTLQKSVATFAADAHSLDAGTGSNSVSWLLTNSPSYQTGSYTATVTFTISAT